MPKKKNILTNEQLISVRKYMEAAAYKLVEVEHLMTAAGVRAETDPEDGHRFVKLSGAESLWWILEIDLHSLSDGSSFQACLNSQDIDVNYHTNGPTLELTFNKGQGWTAGIIRHDRSEERPEDTSPLILELADHFRIPGLDIRHETVAEAVNRAAYSVHLGFDNTRQIWPTKKLEESEAIVILSALAKRFASKK